MALLPNHPYIEMLHINVPQPNPNNPHSNRKQRRKYESLIRRTGSKLPVIIDDQNVILIGEDRLEAYKALGHTEVPVIRVSFMTDNDKRVFMIGEARLAELGEWDKDILKRELTYLFEDDYEIELTGFTLADLDFSTEAVPNAGKVDRVDLPDPAAVAVTRPGDLWYIGPHRLFCGDATQMSAFEALLAGERAAMIFSDPPYNVPIAGHVSGNANAREFAMASGEMTVAEFTAFLRAVFRLCAMFSSDGSIHFQCMDFRHMREVLDAGDGVYTQFKQLIVWDKGLGGQGAFYRSQHELIFVFKSGRAKHTNNFGLGETGRYRTNIWSYPGAVGFRKGREQDLADHPTIKSLAMVMDAIFDCSNRGDLILDPFSGSATTLCAAHKTGRRGAAIEIDPLYVDTGIRRLCQLSGLTAVHADGQTFEEVAAERMGQQEAANVEG